MLRFIKSALQKAYNLITCKKKQNNINFQPVPPQSATAINGNQDPQKASTCCTHACKKGSLRMEVGLGVAEVLTTVASFIPFPIIDNGSSFGFIVMGAYSVIINKQLYTHHFKNQRTTLKNIAHLLQRPKPRSKQAIERRFLKLTPLLKINASATQHHLVDQTIKKLRSQGPGSKLNLDEKRWNQLANQMKNKLKNQHNLTRNQRTFTIAHAAHISALAIFMTTWLAPAAFDIAGVYMLGEELTFGEWLQRTDATSILLSPNMIFLYTLALFTIHADQEEWQLTFFISAMIITMLARILSSLIAIIANPIETLTINQGAQLASSILEELIEIVKQLPVTDLEEKVIDLTDQVADLTGKNKQGKKANIKNSLVIEDLTNTNEQQADEIKTLGKENKAVKKDRIKIDVENRELEYKNKLLRAQLVKSAKKIKRLEHEKQIAKKSVPEKLPQREITTPPNVVNLGTDKKMAPKKSVAHKKRQTGAQKIQNQLLQKAYGKNAGSFFDKQTMETPASTSKERKKTKTARQIRQNKV
jgi:hypothetical protein